MTQLCIEGMPKNHNNNILSITSCPLQALFQLVPPLLQASSHLVPLLLQTSSLHFLVFLLKLFYFTLKTEFSYSGPLIKFFLHLHIDLLCRYSFLRTVAKISSTATGCNEDNHPILSFTLPPNVDTLTLSCFTLTSQVIPDGNSTLKLYCCTCKIPDGACDGASYFCVLKAIEIYRQSLFKNKERFIFVVRFLIN